jgi:hypothetical protein
MGIREYIKFKWYENQVKELQTLTALKTKEHITEIWDDMKSGRKVSKSDVLKFNAIKDLIRSYRESKHKNKISIIDHFMLSLLFDQNIQRIMNGIIKPKKVKKSNNKKNGKQKKSNNRRTKSTQRMVQRGKR